MLGASMASSSLADNSDDALTTDGHISSAAPSKHESQPDTDASPAESFPIAAAQPGWWARLTSSSAAADQSFVHADKNKSAVSTEEKNEGWWAWASERLAKRPAPSPPVELPLPVDKLSCKMHKDSAGGTRQPVVLLACGSFNPPTIAHLRMFELAYDALTERGFDVLGGYMSPVNDAYGKPDLVSAEHRLCMARLAADTSEIIMVDSWEAAQPAWQRSLSVMTRLRDSLADGSAARQMTDTQRGPSSETADAADFPGSHHARGVVQVSAISTPKTAANVTAEEPTVGSFTRHSAHAAWAAPHAAPAAATAAALPSAGASLRSSQDTTVAQGRSLMQGNTLMHGGIFDQSKEMAAPRVMLLCGADMVESFITPGVWLSQHIQQIVGPDHGVVCIARRGSDLQRMLTDSSSANIDLTQGIMVVEDPLSWDVSSTAVRSLLQQGKSVKYLLPNEVLNYVKRHSLYTDTQ